MRLADRLFAFRRLPAWTDAVQVLLWMLAWLVVLALLALLLFQYVPVVRVLSGGRPGEFGAVFALAMLLSLVLTVGGAVMGCWFVSEAYGGWRAGHRHGRQWAILIGALLLLSPLMTLAFLIAGEPRIVEGAQPVILAVQTALGLALLIASLTTKPPTPRPPTTA